MHNTYQKTKYNIESLDLNNKQFVKKISQWCYDNWTHECHDAKIYNKHEYEDYVKNKDECYLHFISIHKESNQICGCVSVVKNDISTYLNYGPWVASLYVCPQYRNNGISKMLLSYLIEYLKVKREYPKIYLWTKKNTLSLYLKFEFRIIKEMTYLDNQIYIMVLDLNNM